MFYSDNSIYFFTDSTFLHFPYFKTDDQKYIILGQIKKLNKILGIPISAYSVAINHYHLKFYLRYSADMAKVKQILRGGISYEYRKRYKIKYEEMWQTRKILLVKSNEVDWKITGYIIGNLLKHKEVGTFEELKNNLFSSYGYMANKYGDEEMRQLVYRSIKGEESWETF